MFWAICLLREGLARAPCVLIAIHRFYAPPLRCSRWHPLRARGEPEDLKSEEWKQWWEDLIEER